MRWLLGLFALQGVAHADWLKIDEPAITGTYGAIAIDAKQFEHCDQTHRAVEVSFRIERDGSLRDIDAGGDTCLANVVKKLRVTKPSDGPVDVVLSLLFGELGSGVSRFTRDGWGSIGPGREGTIGHGMGACCDDASAPKPVKPRITFLEPALTGDYDRAAVTRWFSQHRDPFERCLVGNVAATATVRLEISAEGKATEVSANGMVASCLADEARKLEFPKPKHGPVRIAVPFKIAKGLL